MLSFFPEWAEFNGWPEERQRADRFPLMRLIRFAPSATLSADHVKVKLLRSAEDRETLALSVNVSNGGLCMLSSWAPQEGEVLRVQVPIPASAAQTPTLAEVRWVRALPGSVPGYAVGLRFLL